MNKRTLIPEMEDRRKGWLILTAVSFLFFAGVWALLFLPVKTTNGKLLLNLGIYLLWFIFAIVFGYFAFQMTGKVLPPLLLYIVLLALCRAGDPAGILLLQPVGSVGEFFAEWLYGLWYALRFAAIAFAVGIYTKNLR